MNKLELEAKVKKTHHLHITNKIDVKKHQNWWFLFLPFIANYQTLVVFPTKTMKFHRFIALMEI